jgi:ssRNA-specific RNase YbeY (16S rRNA maturation enzyme)
MSSDGSHPGTRLRVSVVDASGRPLRLPALAGWLARTAPARARGAVTIALVSDSRVRALNRQYRDTDRPTDVLSFPPFAREAGRRVPTAALRAKVGGSRSSNELPLASRNSRPEPHVTTGTARAKVGPSGSPKGRRAADPRIRQKPDPTYAGNDGVPFLGDVVIARGVAARQARAAGHDERTEWRVLALHGLLHLLGYDHERDAGEMLRVEARLRRKGGLDAGLIERGSGR